MRGAGGALFAGIVLMVVGVLNIVYGIAAVSNSKFFVEDTHFVFTTLHTWGWIAIIVGAIEVSASLSLFAGGTYGRVVGIVAAFIRAIESLLNVGGAHPWWSLGIFAVCVWVIYSLTVLGEPETV